MLWKAVAVIAVVLLPLSALLWHKSHKAPFQRRYEPTLYSSLRVYLKDGVCGLRLLSMPTKTASRSGFRTTLEHVMTPGNRSLHFSSRIEGPYRISWAVFPLWLPTLLLLAATLPPVFRGPVLVWWRQIKGWCLECGYDLTGNRAGRCPECGTRFRS